jgi:hopanoid biosynthesis associated protein HpnK
MSRKIIINADDFGLCKGVNEAVAQAYSNGILTSTTIMANMPAASEAVDIAKKLPNLGVGAHLNIFEGSARSEDSCVDCLLDADGQFALSPFKLSLLSIFSSKIRNAVKAEFAAQMEWLIDNGIKLTHLDSHKHIHSFPVIFSIVCDLARRFGIPAIRFTFEPKEICRPPWPSAARDGKKRAGIIRKMARINRLQDSSFFKTKAVLGIAHTGKIDVDFFKAVVLYNSINVVEVMTHPGYDYGLSADKTRLIEQRRIELEALCSEKTRQYFKNAAIKLVNYGTLCSD